ncbi:unnamed protein product [Schistosoma mattheei]|uniref:Uncharacterized protein n=1 Tax=Schistosoma mattheei TaxID=31246 RepID=A0A183NJ49_9TREM|nr:unnamed protein product [Schistosoma mattheei]
MTPNKSVDEVKSTTINHDDVLPTNEKIINTTVSNTNTTISMDKPTITNISNPNQNYTNNDTVHQSLVNGFSSPTYNIQNDYTTNNTNNTTNNNTCSSLLNEQQLNNSYDFCTLPRSRNRDYQIKGDNHYNEMKNDELLSTTMNQLQTDLMNSRFNEADTKKILHELRCKLHELEEVISMSLFIKSFIMMS